MLCTMATQFGGADSFPQSLRMFPNMPTGNSLCDLRNSRRLPQRCKKQNWKIWRCEGDLVEELWELLNCFDSVGSCFDQPPGSIVEPNPRGLEFKECKGNKERKGSKACCTVFTRIGNENHKPKGAKNAQGNDVDTRTDSNYPASPNRIVRMNFQPVGDSRCVCTCLKGAKKTLIS